MNAHVDVAAYALGALDDRDSTLFEEHLAECDACAEELESMLPVVNLLADVDVEAVMAEPPLPLQAEPVQDEPRRPRRSTGPATGPIPLAPRRRPAPARGRFVLGLAAAATVVGVVSGGALLLGPGFLEDEKAPPVAEGTPAPTISADDEGEKFAGTDSGTGVQADVVLAAKVWGTKVTFDITKVDGPRTCRLVAVRKNGKDEVLSSWSVPDHGYGTKEQPRGLSLEASTALQRDEITELKVESVESDGSTDTLLTLET